MNELRNASPEELYRLAVRTWGKPAQLDMAIEELAELIVALQHWKRGRDNRLGEVAGELADVDIMIGQLRIVFEQVAGEIALEEFRFEAVKTEKLNRLADRLARYLGTRS